MEKTNREWLSEMDEPERSEALANAEQLQPHTLDKFSNKSISNTLVCAFVWAETTQGREYWSNIAEKYL